MYSILENPRSLFFRTPFNYCYVIPILFTIPGFSNILLARKHWYVVPICIVIEEQKCIIELGENIFYRKFKHKLM